VRDLDSFRDIAVLAKKGSDGVLTQAVITPTPAEVMTVLCGDEDIARTFNSLELDTEKVLVVVQTVTHPSLGGTDAQLSELMITPSEPTVAKLGVAFSGAKLRYVYSRENDWYSAHYEIRLPHVPFGGEPEEASIPGKGATSIDMINTLCKGDFHFHDRMMSQVQGSAYRWAIRLFEARNVS